MRLIQGRYDDELAAVLHPLRDLSEPERPKTGVVGWWGWQQLRGGGVRSFLRWLGEFGEVSWDDSVYILHLLYGARGTCHEWAATRYCYCDTTDPDGEPLRLSELVALRRSA